MSDGSWRFFDHTADLGIEVTASSLEDLFATSASALFEILGADPRASTGKRHLVTLQAADQAELLVLWLAELLYVHETEGVGFDTFEVVVRDGYRLEAVASVGAASPRWESRDPREVKAVTYHGASVRQVSAGSWVARVVLDV